MKRHNNKDVSFKRDSADAVRFRLNVTHEPSLNRTRFDVMSNNILDIGGAVDKTFWLPLSSAADHEIVKKKLRSLYGLSNDCNVHYSACYGYSK